MSAIPVKYKTSEYLKSSSKFLSSKEKKSIQFLGNAWHQYSTDAESEMPAYIQKFPISKFLEKNVSNRLSPIKKNLEVYLYFHKEIIPFSLKHIYDEIELSKEILDLEKGWDGFDAPQIPKEIYYGSITFLKEYSNFIFKKTGLAIDAPEINPGRNQNIFLSWRTKNARLAISVEKKDEELIANYYGDLNHKQPIKGYVSIEELSEYLAYWMKNLI